MSPLQGTGGHNDAISPSEAWRFFTAEMGVAGVYAETLREPDSYCIDSS